MDGLFYCGILWSWFGIGRRGRFRIAVATTVAVGRLGGLGIAVATCWRSRPRAIAIWGLAWISAPCWWGTLGWVIVWLRSTVGRLIVAWLGRALVVAWWFAIIDYRGWCHTVADRGKALVVGGLGLLGVTGWFGGVIMPDGDVDIDLLGLSGEYRYVVIATICGHRDFVTFGDMDAFDGHFDVFLAITIAHNQVGAGVGGTCDGGSTFGLIEANVAGGFFINS